MRTVSLNTVAKRFAIGLAAIFVAACQTAPAAVTASATVRPVPAPVSSPSPELTSILARNFGAYDAGVFAVAEDGKAAWLTNVPAGGTRTIPVAARHLQASGLVLRVLVIGSGRTWTSGPTLIDGQSIGVLDLAADRGGDPAGTLLRFVPATAFQAEMR
jgi:hypothetical protein